MVKRLARRGSSAGSTFWGCSSYPKCRGTRAS
jgi:restriction system protein